MSAAKWKRVFSLEFISLFVLASCGFNQPNSEQASKINALGDGGTPPSRSNRAFFTVDVSGQDGVDGKAGLDGRRGQDGSVDNFDRREKSGGPGERGTSATAASAGQNAGATEMSLKLLDGGKSLNLSGVVVSPSGKFTHLEQKIAIESEGWIQFSARGGSGGKGANGGNGGNGGQGLDGRDEIDGPVTSGGHGGNGGHGGLGSAGADGGKGGNIILKLKEEDAAALWLVRHDVRAGDGGEVGQSGVGGRGGSGGRAGDLRPGSKRPVWLSDGKAGINGINGPTNNLVRGRNGEAGSFKILIEDKAGNKKEYSKGIDLQLQKLKFSSTVDDGILEPGEKITLEELILVNNGDVSTPKEALTLTNFEAKFLKLTKASSLDVGGNIGGGSTRTISKPGIEWLVQSPEVTREYFQEETSLAPNLNLTGVTQRIARDWPLTVTYPVRMQGEDKLELTDVAKTGALKWSISNLSEKLSYGRDGDTKRKVSLVISDPTGNVSQQVRVWDESTQTEIDLSKNSWTREIDKLPTQKNGALAIKLRVELKANAKLYKNSPLEVKLVLEGLDGKDVVVGKKSIPVIYGVDSGFQFRYKVLIPEANIYCTFPDGSTYMVKRLWAKKYSGYDTISVSFGLSKLFNSWGYQHEIPVASLGDYLPYFQSHTTMEPKIAFKFVKEVLMPATKNDEGWRLNQCEQQ